MIPILPGTAFTNAAGSLNDGIYTLTVNAALVVGAGSAGPMAGGNFTLTFHRLFGDLDGNGALNNADFARFKQSYAKTIGTAGYNPDIDYDGNGAINIWDYSQLQKRLGTTLSY